MSQRNPRDEELKREWLEMNRPTICPPMPAVGFGSMTDTMAEIIARISIGGRNSRGEAFTRFEQARQETMKRWKAVARPYMTKRY